MRLLLDSNAFLWIENRARRIPDAARTALDNPSATKLLSIATVWELSIKLGIGKLQLSHPLEAIIAAYRTRSDFGILPIRESHALRVAQLPHHHRDPFDRLLVAQAIIEDVPLVSSDETLDAYGIRRIWV